MNQVQKTHIAHIKKDGKGFDPEVFMYLEGPCKSCKISNNSIIVMSYTPNTEDKGEGVLSTVCMCCMRKNVYFYKNISIQEEN